MNRKATQVLVMALVMVGLFYVGAGAYYVGTDTVIVKNEYVDVSLSVPVLQSLEDWLIQEYLNTKIRSEHISFAYEVAQDANRSYTIWQSESSYPFHSFEAFSKFAVKYSDANVLSLVTDFYEYAGGAHGMTIKHATNIDLKSGTKKALFDVIEEADVVTILAQVNAQVALEPENYFANQLPINHINETDFYLTEEGLVVFYQLYEIAPYSSGIREFVIPWSLLTD